MSRLLLVAGLLAALVCGCGYHRPGAGESFGQIHTLHLALFGNSTYQPFLENELTNAVTQRFLRTRRWRLVEDGDGADAVFSGTVSRFKTVPVSFDKNDKVQEYRAEITVKAQLASNPEGRILWKGEASWSEEYPGSLDKGLQEDYKSQAIAAIAERLAEELYARMSDNF